MSQPTAGGMCRLKRLGRFPKYRPRCVQVFKQQESPKFLTGRVDSDFAGCLTTRKSTSSTQLIHGNHLLRSSATTQSVQALSSGEAEFHALVNGGSVGLGGVSMLRDLNTSKVLELQTDSSAAKGICKRRGIGKVRHLHAPVLWIQGKVASKEIMTKKSTAKRIPRKLGPKS